MCSASSEWMIQCWCTSWQICSLPWHVKLLQAMSWPEAVAWQQVIFYDVVKNRIRQVALRQLICNFSQLELALRSLKSKVSAWQENLHGALTHPANMRRAPRRSVFILLVPEKLTDVGPKKRFSKFCEKFRNNMDIFNGIHWPLDSYSPRVLNYKTVSVLATRSLPNRTKVFIVFGLLGKIFG